MTTADVLATAITSLNDIVATAQIASAPLRTQRDTLLVQASNLQTQIAALNAKILALEGPDVLDAQNALMAFDNSRQAPGRFTQVLQAASDQVATADAKVPPI